MTYYADDPDVNVSYPIKDAKGGDLDFTPVVQVAGQPDITAAWDGTVRPHPTETGSTERDLKIPLTGLAAGSYRLRLVIPGDNDIPLGTVRLI